MDRKKKLCLKCEMFTTSLILINSPLFFYILYPILKKQAMSKKQIKIVLQVIILGYQREWFYYASYHDHF